MHRLNKDFNKVVCICLKEREDKYKHMKEQFERLGIEVEFFRPVIPGYADKIIEPYIDKYNKPENNYILFNKHFPNEFGAMNSHYTVIKTALLEGVQNLFVFEDDCLFVKNFNELLPKCLDTLPKDSDGILLYSFMSNLEQRNIRVAPRWTKGYASWSFIAYSLNQRAMRGYIELQDKQPMIADRGSWTMMTYLDYNFYICSPPLVIPSKEFSSNIRGENKNYEKTKSIFLLGVNELNYE